MIALSSSNNFEYHCRLLTIAVESELPLDKVIEFDEQNKSQSDIKTQTPF